MTLKERLHELVDELSDGEADEALRYIAQRRSDPVIAAFRDAPVDDEPVTTPTSRRSPKRTPTVTPASHGSRSRRSRADIGRTESRPRVGDWRVIVELDVAQRRQ